MKRLVVAILILCSFEIAWAQSGVFTNGFEREDSFGYWINVNRVYDTTAYRGNYVNHLDTTDEYGLGFAIHPTEEMKYQNISITFSAFYRFNGETPNAKMVVDIKGSKDNYGYWDGHDITDEDGEWTKNGFSTTIPADYVPKDGIIKLYLWNSNHQNIDVDEARIEIKTARMPRFLPDHQDFAIAGRGKNVVEKDLYGVSYHFVNKTLSLTNADNVSITKAIYAVTEAIIETDTMTFFGNQWQLEDDTLFVCKTPVGNTEITFQEGDNGQLLITTQSRYNLDMRIVRQALVIPFNDDVTEVYRTNCTTDTSNFQNCYYLSDKGFSIGKGISRVSAYHNSKISSLQLDAENKTAYFNADYWRDHPLIHYPLNNDTLDYFVDVSCREVTPESVISSTIELYVGIDAERLPVFMPVDGGYSGAIIFTEHADWTDIRTQRAVLFGNENITEGDSAVGGFVYHLVPVTKSVFYNNPDNITNEERSGGAFTSEQANLMMDDNQEFYNTIEELHQWGFDICLHTPEQYTTQGDNLEEALAFMHEKFNSVSWIDHGYNNTAKHNREDLVCDGLQISAPLWKKYGIRYLWNAYYEENPLPQYDFDCNLMHPYPGFGDALPHPQITTLPDGDTSFLLWSTPNTFETDSDSGWDYFFSIDHLLRIAKNHEVFITHIYPAWVLQERSFWEYDADSVITARKGFNDALARISEMMDFMTTITIAEYLQYYEAVKKIKYVINDRNHITLINMGEYVEGLSLLFSEKPEIDFSFDERPKIDGKRVFLHEIYGGLVIEFDLDKNESITIKYRE